MHYSDNENSEWSRGTPVPGARERLTSQRPPRQSLLQFVAANEKWWQKPLVTYQGQNKPAELAVLDKEIAEGEKGVWLNSRSTSSGVSGLVRDQTGKYKTVRTALPGFVSAKLAELYTLTGLLKGMPDLVIWHEASRAIRLVEVKCPHWDRPSPEQDQFLAIAATHGVPSTIVEWEFCD
jgi:hypothetical protein